MKKNAADIWRRIIKGENKSWVLFEQGTCVILIKPEEDLAEQAKILLKKWGKIFPGTSSADFQVIQLDNDLGWIVTCHHPDILNHVELETEVHQENAENNLIIGMIGRSCRDQDAQELQVIHIEDKRAPTYSAV